MSITADEDVRNKIVSCVTFNAPGHSEEFIDMYKVIISRRNCRVNRLSELERAKYI